MASLLEHYLDLKHLGQIQPSQGLVYKAIQCMRGEHVSDVPICLCTRLQTISLDSWALAEGQNQPQVVCEQIGAVLPLANCNTGIIRLLLIISQLFKQNICCSG